MSTLHPNQPAVKSPISSAEWAAYAAARNARQYVAPVFAVGDRVLYRTPRNSRGGGRNIRGTVVKVNAKSVTIEYAMLDRLTKEIVGYKRQAVNPVMLAKVVEPVAEPVADVNWNSGVTAGLCSVCHVWIDRHGRCNCNSGPELVNVQQDGFDLDLLPWESAQDVIDEAEAVLDEMACKPGLGVDDAFDELDFLGATLDAVRLGLTPVVRLSAAQMEEIENERIGEHFSMNGFAY